MSDYTTKYLKYKNKYINLKKQIGGHDIMIEKDVYKRTIDICKKTIGSPACIAKLLNLARNISKSIIEANFNSDQDKKSLKETYDKLLCNKKEDNVCSKYTSGGVKITDINEEMPNIRSQMSILYSIAKHIIGNKISHYNEINNIIGAFTNNIRYRVGEKKKDPINTNKLNIELVWPLLSINNSEPYDKVYVNNYLIEEFHQREIDAYQERPKSVTVGTNLFKLPDTITTVTNGIYSAGTSGHTCRILALCKLYIGSNIDIYRYHLICICLIWMVSHAHHSAREILLLLPIFYYNENNENNENNKDDKNNENNKDDKDDKDLYNKIYSLFEITTQFDADKYINTLNEIFTILVTKIDSVNNNPITINNSPKDTETQIIQNISKFTCFAKKNIKTYDFIINPKTTVECSN
jgi:hypothetical protein